MLHTHKQREGGEKACLRTVVISQLWCLVWFSESQAFRSHCFYQHVCAESALEIIYGFKNTDILHSFGVILLKLFWGLLIHSKAHSSMWSWSVVWKGSVYPCVGWLTREMELKWFSYVNLFTITLCSTHNLPTIPQAGMCSCSSKVSLWTWRPKLCACQWQTRASDRSLGHFVLSLSINLKQLNTEKHCTAHQTLVSFRSERLLCSCSSCSSLFFRGLHLFPAQTSSS